MSIPQNVDPMPAAIFNRVNADMDDSEEMEEIREVLYEMIKKNFPMGVAASHLSEKYQKEYVETGLGRPLPDDWLQQVTAAEEFEAQDRGPITILFVRLSNTTSFKRPPISSVNVRVVSAEPTSEELKKLKHRKENEPNQHAKSLKTMSTNLKEAMNVSVVSVVSPRKFFIRATDDNNQFERIGATLADIYSQERTLSRLDSRVAIYEICTDGAYALQDSSGMWFRVIVKEPPHAGMVLCHFVDVGVCEKFPVSAIRLLPEIGHPVMSVGSMAHEVCLDINEEDSIKFTNRFIELTFEEKSNGVAEPINLKISSINESVVDLVNLKGESITELIRNPTGVVRLTSPVSTSNNNNNINNNKSKESKVSTPLLCSFEKPTTIQPMSIDQMPNTSFPVNAIFAAGPTDISLRQLSLDPMPDYMYAKLQEECLIQESMLLDNDPQFGAFYAAFVDERWERVQCIRASKIDRETYCVYLIDVGVFQYVKRETLRRLNSSSPFKKMLMFKCKIAGIRPIIGDVWSRESHEAVRDFFESSCGEQVLVEPIGSFEWNEWKQLNAPSVPVCQAKLSCGGRDIGEWLISCGLALPK